MANIRSSLAFVLVWVNLIVISLNTYFSVKAMKYLDNNPPYNYNLRGTKEKSTKTNSYYFLEKEIETQKKLRNLSPKKLRLAILIINCFGFYFVFQLSVSFGLEPAEDCDSCCPSCVVIVIVIAIVTVVIIAIVIVTVVTIAILEVGGVKIAIVEKGL